MNHIKIADVELRAAEFEAFSQHPDLREFEREDYARRAANLREFARQLLAHRQVDANLQAARAGGHHVR